MKLFFLKKIIKCKKYVRSVGAQMRLCNGIGVMQVMKITTAILMQILSHYGDYGNRQNYNYGIAAAIMANRADMEL